MNHAGHGTIPVRLNSLLFAFLLLLAWVYYSDAIASASAAAKGAFFTGQCRNLFVEAGHSQQEVTNLIHTAFRQLFHGDPQSEAVYFSGGSNTNGPLAFICDINSRDIRSEGIRRALELGQDAHVPGLHKPPGLRLFCVVLEDQWRAQ